VSAIQKLETVNHMACWKRCCGSIPVESTEDAAKFIRRCRILTTQFAVVTPILAVIAVILRYADPGHDHLHNSSTSAKYGFLWLGLIHAVSTILAMYHLRLISSAIARVEGMQKFNVNAKMFCVFLGVLLPNLQHTIISAIAAKGSIVSTSDYDVEEIASFTFFQLYVAEIAIITFM
jgi:hypothetical protein